MGGSRSGGSGNSGPSCPFGIDGGCAASPGGNFQVTTAALQLSGQTWTTSHPWGWNSCGIDYACGYYTATASLIPADQINTVASACTYNATGNGAGGPLITCTATTNLNITGVDFTRVGANATGTTCVSVHINSGQAGTITIKDNKFDASVNNGSNACHANIADSGIGTYLVFFANSSSAGLDVESNYGDGGGATATGGVGQFFFVFAGVGASVTIKYNAFLHANSPDFIFGATTTYPSSIVSQYNYAQGWVYSPPGYHGEFYQIGGGAASGTLSQISSTFDTLSTDNLQYFNGTSGLIWMPLGGSGAGTITQATIDHDVMVTNNTTNGGTGNTSGGLGRLGSATYTHINLTNNYLDLTGVNGGSNAWIMDAQGICTNPATISGNTLLTTPGGAGHNAWDSNSGTGC